MQTEWGDVCEVMMIMAIGGGRTGEWRLVG